MVLLSLIIVCCVLFNALAFEGPNYYRRKNNGSITDGEFIDASAAAKDTDNGEIQARDRRSTINCYGEEGLMCELLRISIEKPRRRPGRGLRK